MSASSSSLTFWSRYLRKCFKDESSSPNSNLVDFFKDSAIQSLASTSTESQGLGLAQTMYEQMKRNYNL